MSEQTVKCAICGAPYKVYDMSVADQSACPDCVREAARRRDYPTRVDEDARARRRARYFGDWG